MSDTEQCANYRHVACRSIQVFEERHAPLLPRHKRNCHADKCQREYNHHRNTRTRKLRHVCHIKRRRRRLIAHVIFVVAFFHFRGVAHRKYDRRSQTQQPNNRLNAKHFVQLNAGRFRCNTCRKWIQRRAKHTRASAKHNHHYRGHRIVAGCHHDRHDKRIKRHRFFLHTVRCTADREEYHQDRNKPLLFALHLAEQRAKRRIKRAGFHRYAQEAAENENEHDNIKLLRHTFDRRDKGVPQPLATIMRDSVAVIVFFRLAAIVEIDDFLLIDFRIRA